MARAVTVLDLVRHGEPEGGVKIRGWQDDPLSEVGWEQMWQALGQASPWSTIVSSPMSRCVEFARQVASKYALPLEQEDRFRELGFGDWEGLDPEHLYATVPDAINNFWLDPGANQPPGAEPFLLFQRRVVAAWEDIRDRHQGRHPLLIAHGGVIRMLLAHVLGMPAGNMFRLEVPFAAVSRIRIEQDGVARLTFHCGSL